MDDAIEHDIYDEIEAVILRNVAIFTTKYETPIMNYSKNRSSSDLEMTSKVTPMVLDLAQLCKDVRYKAEIEARREQIYRKLIAESFLEGDQSWFGPPLPPSPYHSFSLDDTKSLKVQLGFRQISDQ